MISEIIKTPPADRPGPEIVDQMMATRAMAIARGRAEISANHLDRKQIRGTSALRPYMRPGSIVLYTDRDGNQHRCLLRSAACTVSRTGGNDGQTFTATTNVVLEYKTERRR